MGACLRRLTSLPRGFRSGDIGGVAAGSWSEVAVFEAVAVAFEGEDLGVFEYACTLAVSIAYLLLRQQDAVGCLAFDETVRNRVALHTKRSHLNSIIQALAVSEPNQKTDMLTILRGAVETYPRRGLMILISDLLVERESLFAGLRLLRQMGHDVVVFHIMDDDETRFSVQRGHAVRGPGTAGAFELQSPGAARRLPRGACIVSCTTSVMVVPARGSITRSSGPASHSTWR